MKIELKIIGNDFAAQCERARTALLASESTALTGREGVRYGKVIPAAMLS